MRTFTILFLTLAVSVQSAVPNTSLLPELQKFPALFRHFQEHKMSSDISFSSFLALHYSGQEKPSDRKHEQLPFHGPHPSIQIPSVFIPPLFDLLPDHPLADLSKSWGHFYLLSETSEYYASFLKPPQGE